MKSFKSKKLLNTASAIGCDQDYVLALIKKFRLPLTRENYLGLAYPEGVPKDLDENSLPREIRLG